MERWRRVRAGVLTAIAVTVAARAVGTVPAIPRQPADAPIESRVDRLFAAWQRPGSPGCSVGVSRGGATVLERGYGTAHVEHGVPITPAAVFHVASVTKPFTALSILLLARDGKLSLADDVRAARSGRRADDPDPRPRSDRAPADRAGHVRRLARRGDQVRPR